MDNDILKDGTHVKITFTGKIINRMPPPLNGYRVSVDNLGSSWWAIVPEEVTSEIKKDINVK